MKNLTNKDYQRAAKEAMKKTFGFSPAMKDIVPLEGSETSGIVTAVAFAISGKGYSWVIGQSVERADVYDI